MVDMGISSNIKKSPSPKWYMIFWDMIINHDLNFKDHGQCHKVCHLKGFQFLKFTWKVIYHWKRPPYFPFLANLNQKQGISSEYDMVDFICKGLLDMWWARTENYKMKNSCQHWDSNPGPSACKRSERAKRWTIRADKYRSPKGERILPECAINTM